MEQQHFAIDLLCQIDEEHAIDLEACHEFAANELVFQEANQKIAAFHSHEIRQEHKCINASKNAVSADWEAQQDELKTAIAAGDVQTANGIIAETRHRIHETARVCLVRMEANLDQASTWPVRLIPILDAMVALQENHDMALEDAAAGCSTA